MHLIKKSLILTITIIANITIAFETVTFNLENPEQAIADISNYLTGDTNNYKIEKLVLPECTSAEFYKLFCSGESFFLKKISYNNIDYNLVITSLLQQQDLNFYENLAMPLYEFIFNGSNNIKTRYLVYKFIEGQPLSNFIKNILEQPYNEMLLKIYAQLGIALASIHKHGLTEVSNDFCTLASQLVHDDLHSDNIIINQANNQPIIIDAENGFSRSFISPKLIKTDINNFLIQSFPIVALMMDDHSIEELERIYPYIVDFVTSYSAELSTKNNIDFRQQINNHVIKELTDKYLYIVK
jgi:serine/threonine protein kinase